MSLTIDDFCERDRPTWATSNQSKALINKGAGLRVLKVMESVMCFDNPRRKSGSPPAFHFLNYDITYVRDHHQASKYSELPLQD